MRLLIVFALVAVVCFLVYSFKKVGIKTSIHQFKAKTINGALFNFENLKGKKILIVNTASKCGLTPQFKDLETIFEKYKDKNFTIIGFPCNQFKEQDAVSNADINAFCTRNYGVTFTMMEKIDVKGDSACEIYKWLTTKQLNGVMNSSVKWNFQKYMVDENGFLVDFVLPFKKPDCSKIINWINN